MILVRITFVSLLVLATVTLPTAAEPVSAIVFTRSTDQGPEVWRVDIDGNNQQRLGDGGDASWSPDGTRLTFVREVDGNTDIYIMDADGNDVKRLTRDPADEHSPTWSPDGSMIAFNSDRSGSDQVWRSNVDAGNWGRNLTQLTDDTPHSRVNNFVSWSPDGRWLAFEADRDRDDPEIYLANAVDGTNQQRLTFTRALDEVPSWTPDSRRILFSSDMHDEPQSGTYDIYIMNVDGSGQQRLTTTPGAASYPTMSADQVVIVYSYQPGRDGRSDIWIMNADGTNQRLLIEDGGIPRLSPY